MSLLELPSASFPAGAFNADGAPARSAFIQHRVVVGMASWCLALAAWTLCNPYFGAGDGSLIYIARGMADLDPLGVGRDMMFRLDGQSAYTVFTPLFRELARWAGFGLAAKITALAALLSGVAATAVLAAQMARGATRFVIIVFVGALPGAYGGYQIFSYLSAESSPRPFAEALVILSAAALLARRPLLATLCVAIAGTLHPIMALAGASLVALWLVLDDRRWLVLFAGLLAAMGAAAYAGVPPLDRIGTIVDPEWRAILVERNPHLFPSLWLDGTLGRYGTRAATLLIAALVSPPPLRRLFLGVIAIGLAGFLTAYVIGERFHILLVLQVQPWRMAWLTFALAAAAGAIVCRELWVCGPTGKLALVCLAFAWTFANDDRVAFLLAGAAVGLHISAGALDHVLTPRILRAVLVGSAAILAIRFAGILYGYYLPFPQLTLEGALQIRRALAQPLDLTVPAFAIALCVAMRWHRAPMMRHPALGIVVAIALTAFAGLTWDQRSKRNRLIDDAAPPTDLAALLSDTPGEVYWINGLREPWSWLGRPQWLSSIQGAGIVFDRDLAFQFRDRARRAIVLGLADDDVVTPLTEPHIERLPVLARDRVETFCSATDAPAWIVAPDVDGAPLPAGLAGSNWTAPIARYEPLQRDGGYVWQRIDRYWVVPCHTPS